MKASPASIGVLSVLMSNESLAGNHVIELPLRAMQVIGVRTFARRDAANLNIEGVPLVQVRGLRFAPQCLEISLPAPANFPLGEDQVSSTSSFVFILCINFHAFVSAIDGRSFGLPVAMERKVT